jgi:hypothetical protein
MFQPAELQMFIYLEMDRGLLPVGAPSFEVYVFQVALACEQRGIVARNELWDALVLRRPMRRPEIRRVQSLYMRPPDDDPPVPPKSGGKAISWLHSLTPILQPRSRARPAPCKPAVPAETLSNAERRLCVEALATTGSIADAATLLGVTRHALKRQIIKHRIEWPSGREASAAE